MLVTFFPELHNYFVYNIQLQGQKSRMWHVDTNVTVTIELTKTNQSHINGELMTNNKS